jgi:hypothetical protein
MGPTIGEDYVSGELWGKKLPGSPTFPVNCYYRCGNVLLAIREFLEQEIQMGVGSLMGRSGDSQSPMPVIGLGSYWSQCFLLSFRRRRGSIISLLIEMCGLFYVTTGFIFPRSYTNIRSSQYFFIFLEW